MSDLKVVDNAQRMLKFDLAAYLSVSETEKIARRVRLRHATNAEIAAELRRRAERHDADEVAETETASIATEVLRAYDPERARRLRQVAGWLEDGG